MIPRSLIIDCDPGVDDAIALMLALARPDVLRVEAITTVAGNVAAARTARNACLIREIMTPDGPPVFAGAERPLTRSPVEAGDFHGGEGLGDLAVVAPTQGPAVGHAVDAVIARVRAAPGDVTIAALGPLTNLALALQKAPDLGAMIDRIVLMGGADREGGNITPHAEYNIFADPHAAQVVFDCGAPITVLSLDATHQVRVNEARLSQMAASHRPAARAATSLMAFSNAVAARLTEHPHAPLHDPCVIAWLLAPHLFEGGRCTVTVETEDATRLGQTTPHWEAGDRVDWITGVNADGVFALLTEALA